MTLIEAITQYKYAMHPDMTKIIAKQNYGADKQLISIGQIELKYLVCNKWLGFDSDTIVIDDLSYSQIFNLMSGLNFGKDFNSLMNDFDQERKNVRKRLRKKPRKKGRK